MIGREGRELPAAEPSELCTMAGNERGEDLILHHLGGLVTAAGVVAINRQTDNGLLRRPGETQRRLQRRICLLPFFFCKLIGVLR